MTDDLRADDPLFAQLREPLLWHCTSPTAFRTISVDGHIRPVEGTSNRWSNRPYACQMLGAVCLFDFATESSEKVLSVAARWQPFVRSAQPLTVILGFARNKLPGHLVPYPENRDTTSEASGPIPWVEVCHVGPIPISAVVSHVLVCAVDYWHYSTHGLLDERTLVGTEVEFGKLCAVEAEQRAQDNASLKRRMESPELEARLEQARQIVNRALKQ